MSGFILGKAACNRINQFPSTLATRTLRGGKHKYDGCERFKHDKDGWKSMTKEKKVGHLEKIIAKLQKKVDAIKTGKSVEYEGPEDE